MTNQEFWTTPLNQLLHLPINQQFFEQFEILEILSIKPYQLRFWESEFDGIRNQKEPSSHKYSVDDLKLLLRIKKYLMDDQLTIEKTEALIDNELKAYAPASMAARIEVNSPERINKEQSLEHLQSELAQELNASTTADVMITDNDKVENLEDVINMNALYEEMSLETFQNTEKTKSFNNKQDLHSLQHKIINRIKEIREKLKNW